MLLSKEWIKGLIKRSKKPKLRHFPIVANIDAKDSDRREGEVIELVARMETREVRDKF
jgi:hypothetical protein